LTWVMTCVMTCIMPGSMNCRLAKFLVAFKQLQFCLSSHVLHKPQLLSTHKSVFSQSWLMLADMSSQTLHTTCTMCKDAVDTFSSSSSCLKSTYGVNDRRRKFCESHRSVKQERGDAAGQASQHSRHRLLLRQKEKPENAATKASVCEIRPESQTSRPFFRDQA